MGLFDKFVNRAARIQNKNALTATIAFSLLLAASDGTIARSEIEKTEKLVLANDSLKGFKPAEIRQIIGKFYELFETDYDLGRKKALDALVEISDDSNVSEEVFICGLAVGKDGGLEDKEKAVVVEIGRLLGVNLATYGLA